MSFHWLHVTNHVYYSVADIKIAVAIDDRLSVAISVENQLSVVILLLTTGKVLESILFSIFNIHTKKNIFFFVGQLFLIFQKMTL